ncbi:hypothetical protein CGMCC3_g7899 [Colletotrichum fructicola]|nr:uncharacterized protein CGMCC3_g7899 [Colletotrichum fructicola]KAE9576301.1 hypothetical protein CGMCC3_g7899 [Colletotrichum fructicola]
MNNPNVVKDIVNGVVAVCMSSCVSPSPNQYIKQNASEGKKARTAYINTTIAETFSRARRPQMRP